VRESLLAGDHSRIQGILQLLVQDFAYSAVANSRNGGLIALAAVAIALGTSEVGKYLEFIAPPILACFHDHDSRVRYYACESMYNVSKVSRGSILIYFNPIFDALSKLATDPEISVKNGAELLDRLIKDIVSEKSLFSTTKVGRPTGNELSGLPAVMQVPGTVLLPGSNMSFFNMERFIPLLAERIQVMAPATRLFLVNWISVLDSVPDLELIGYLPEFLDGLFTYLSDVHSDVRIATLNVLGEFLKEIRDVVEIQREKGYLHDRRFQSPLGAELVEKRKSTLSLDQQMSESLSLDEPPQVPSKGVSQTDKEEGHGDLYVPGQGVALDFGKMTKIIQPHLNSLGTIHWRQKL
jgi:vacuole morphology and inheritance protein 14